MNYLPALLHLVLVLPSASLAKPTQSKTQLEQLTHPDCRMALLRAVQQLQPEKLRRSVMHLQFTSHTYFRAPGGSPVREVVVPATLYAKGRQLYFETPQTVMRQDEQYSVVIMPTQQTLYLTRTLPTTAAPSGPAQFALLQDSLVQRAQVVQCQSVEKAGKRYQQVVLSLAPRDRARYGATTLGFKLNNQGAIQELTIVHPTGSLVSKVVYTIEKQEFVAKSAKLPARVLPEVVDAKHQPLAAYRKYRVVDHTQLSRLPY